jgi:hypothetical protein
VQPNPIITLTTDFGYKDPFVGIMKGVILTINPSVPIVDITHNISPQNILEAALTVEMSFASFPKNTIHVVVVDPGVGSPRRPIIVRTGHYTLVGPDNGVFTQIYNLKDETPQVIHITSEHYFMSRRSSTFHGRDIFAPVAAWLSRGIEVLKFGDPITDYVTISLPSPLMPKKNILEGEVISIDHFGNVITNIKSPIIDEMRGSNPGGIMKIFVKGKEAPFVNYFSEAKDTGLYSLINSFGYLEVFINKGNAATAFDIQVGEKVILHIASF